MNGSESVRGSSGRDRLRRLSRGLASVENVWFGRSAGNIVVRAALWPLSKAYNVAVSARTRLYDAGVIPSQAPALPTISVGNLTVGGTGKTPFAAYLAAELSRRARPAIALRGYGSDEIEVHRRLNPDIPVFVNPDRSAAVREAKSYGADIVVLDDAFQHRRIARNADVVLLSAEQVLRPRRLLPAGPWREQLSGAKRADLLVITRKSASIIEAEHAIGIVRAEIPGVPIASVSLVPRELVAVGHDTPDGPLTLPLERLRNANVLAIAAIGEPELFKRQLELLGARVAIEAHRDHHPFSDADIRDATLRVPSDGLAVCTLKDAVKLGGRWPGPSRLWYVSQQLVVDQGVEEVNRLLERVIDARASAATTPG
jgi:tetraacyldisaccharide 4'-kinase